jgi:hypothetical protein
MPDPENKKPDTKPEARRPAETFVSKLVPDPANPPNVIRMTGYRGASSQEGSIRLYVNPELSVYWDIPEGDVLFEQPVPHDADPLGAVTLWVKRDSKMTSNVSQQPSGGEQPMNTFTPGAGAAPQTPILTAPVTITHSITPVCHSHFFYCPPSPPPLLCFSPIPHCPPHSPLVICNVSPLPICVQPVSPTCPPTIPTPQTTFPTTQPTTFQTGSPVAGIQGMQAAPQGAGQQAFTFGGTVGQLPPSIFVQCPSHFFICPTPSVFQHCTIPHTLLCNSPTPICVLPVSPTCTPGTFQTVPTTIPTTGDPGSPVAGGGLGAVAGGFQAAAPQGLSPQFGPVAVQQPFSPIWVCHRISPLIFHCFPSPHVLFCQPSPTPNCFFQQPQIPNFSPLTPGPGTPGPGSPVAGGIGGQVGGAGAQAFTFTPQTLPTHPTWPTPHTFPTWGPTWGPTWPPTHTITITHTPVTFQ